MKWQAIDGGPSVSVWPARFEPCRGAIRIQALSRSRSEQDHFQKRSAKLNVLIFKLVSTRWNDKQSWSASHSAAPTLARASPAIRANSRHLDGRSPGETLAANCAALDR